MSAPDAQGASDKYCAYCSDSDGNLKSREEAVSGLAAFSTPGKGGRSGITETGKTLPDGDACWAHKADEYLPGRQEEIIPGTDRHADNIAIAFCTPSGQE